MTLPKQMNLPEEHHWTQDELLGIGLAKKNLNDNHRNGEAAN
jgi:hypothetical protein